MKDSLYPQKTPHKNIKHKIASIKYHYLTGVIGFESPTKALLYETKIQNFSRPRNFCFCFNNLLEKLSLISQQKGMLFY
jgi:hypothetical protein